MKKISKWILCLTLVICIIIPSLFVSAATQTATTPTGYTQASDVEYVKAEGKYVVNWGARGEVATFLSTYAENFYKTSSTFDDVIKLDGGTSFSNAHKSELYAELKEIMTDAHSYIISYDATRPLYRYTDCVRNDSTQISSFYSGEMFDGTWDSGKTWNREHTWPNSKGDLAGSGENDIMMLRPALKSENGSRGNQAYGTTSAYYNPNSESSGKYDLRGDVSRVILYQYVRWGCINTGSKYNSNDIFGTDGVIESLDVLLLWMEEDPVDTWEMGRNDAVQSITGTRNVFVDYPEYAWALFGEDCPDDLVTPSDNAENIPTNPDKPVVPDEPELPDYIVADTVAADVPYKLGLVQPNVSSTEVYYIDGTMASTYYLGTVTDPDSSLDVYLEAVNGGYNLYTTIGGNKKYINMVVNGTHVNGVYQDTATTVYTFNPEEKVLSSTVNGEEYRFGTRSDKSYTTVGPVKTSYDNFYCQLYTKPVVPDEPDEPEVPDCENGHTYDNEEDLFCNVCDMYKILEPTLVMMEDGTWKYFVNGVWDKEATTLHWLSGKWFFVENGVWSKASRIVKYKDKDFYVSGGKWNKTITDLKWVDGKWHYIQNGKWNQNIDTLHKINGKWFLVKKGIWNKTTGIVEYKNKEFFVQGGKWKSQETLYKKDGKYLAIKGGKWFKDKGIVKYNGKKYYVNKGYAQTSYSGKVTIGGKKYTVKKGIIK